MAHTQFGLVEGAAVAGDVDRADSVDLLQQLQALAGTAFADAGAGDDVVEADGFWCAEQDAEDFAVGLGKAEGLGEIDEQVNDLGFDIGDDVRTGILLGLVNAGGGCVGGRFVCGRWVDQGLVGLGSSFILEQKEPGIKFIPIVVELSRVDGN